MTFRVTFRVISALKASISENTTLDPVYIQLITTEIHVRSIVFDCHIWTQGLFKVICCHVGSRRPAVVNYCPDTSPAWFQSVSRKRLAEFATWPVVKSVVRQNVVQLRRGSHVSHEIMRASSWQTACVTDTGSGARPIEVSRWDRLKRRLECTFNPLKGSGIRWLYFKVFSAIQV